MGWVGFGIYYRGWEGRWGFIEGCKEREVRGSEKMRDIWEIRGKLEICEVLDFMVICLCVKIINQKILYRNKFVSMSKPQIPQIKANSIFQNPHLYPNLPPTSPHQHSHPHPHHQPLSSSPPPTEPQPLRTASIFPKSFSTDLSHKKLSIKNKHNNLNAKILSRYQNIHNKIFSLERTVDDVEEKERNYINRMKKEEYSQQLLIANKMMHLQKLKMNISMCLNKSYGQKWNKNDYLENYNRRDHIEKQKQKQDKDIKQDFMNTRKISYSLDLKKNKANSKARENLYKKKLQKRNKKPTQPSQPLNQKPSITIKQLKPQPKQIFKQTQQIHIPKYGRTYGSYYQIVAIEKKFQNSKYFFNQYPQYIVEGDEDGNGGRDGGRDGGGGKGGRGGRGWIGDKYGGRAGENWVRDRGSRIYYEGAMIQPWKMNQEIGGHGHQGFL